MNVHSGIIHNSQKVKIILASMNYNRQNVTYPYNRILHSNEKQTIDTYYNMDKAQIIMLSKRSQMKKLHVVWFQL